jgi:hypothetical protein
MCVVYVALVFIVKDLVCLLDSLELDFGGGALFFGDLVRVVGQRSLNITQSVLHNFMVFGGRGGETVPCDKPVELPPCSRRAGFRGPL